MNTKIHHILIIILLIFSGNLLAQKTHLQDVKVENTSVVKDANKILMSMDLVLDDLKVGVNDKITLTPVIVSADSPDTLVLAPVIVNGKTRNKVYERNRILNNLPELYPEPYTVLRRENGKSQRVNYATSFGYSEWMSNSELRLLETTSGCADCCEEINDLFLSRVDVPGKYMPVYKLTYIMPEAEEKTRSDKHTATINFYVDKHNLVRDYKNNSAVLDEVDRIVSDIVYNDDLTVSDFEIVGYASPEASVAYNKALSQRRANTFADYLSSKFNVPRNRMKVSGYGEDWEKTREVIAVSNIADKAEILRIIDNVSNPDARDAELKKLSRGTTYQTMLRDYYPQIRRTVYTVSYTVRPFDVEEAKQIIRTNPKLLSLNEMYLVAETYPAESKEFKEVFDIATRLYPNDPIAILNSAAADIEGGNNQAAIDRLLKIENDPRAWNNIAVAYARLGDLQKAKEYFEKSATSGDSDAKANLLELDKVISGF